MEFKKESLKLILIASLFSIILLGLMIWECSPKAESSEAANVEAISPVDQNPDPVPEIAKGDDIAIQAQLDRDRQEQKQTKDLRIKLEQINLELEQEKALAEINKLKIDNTGTYQEPSIEGHKNFPEVKVEFIGGSSVKKEAILSIAGTSFQVKEKSTPTDEIQVISISDTSVTLHFNAPQDLTKIIDFKPE